MRELRIGVIGLGVISRFYLAALPGRTDMRLTAVCDLREEAMTGFGPEVERHLDHRTMLGRGGVDAVVVNVPNDIHAPICRAALEAGVAVCVEKPIATDHEDALELQRLSAKTGVPLFTAFHRRYNSNVLALLRDDAGAPAVESVTVRYYERIEEHVGDDGWYLDPGRCGGGCLADNGPNALDLVRLFLGDVGVTRSDVSYDESGVDRRATVELRAPSGATGAVLLDWSYAHGELKDVTVRYADGSERRADMLAGYSVFKSSLFHEYAGVLDDFARAARGPGGADPHGVAALELVLAAYELASEHS
ncbi:Gfo/Idh/MocA family oxidoreductase [Microbispora cellulosiformans]|uniref:Gfo/Idh/MocA family oxidoreductase n=1 Tax=Microbispora cellulosiformans TaxID=2614688 RepID=A0A5J5JTJ9_9ACTN|nr:Gfo/Idh/MocA family oxidoreductase [Microbispora cellulosiformans]KAA9373291.1 Gfo/Idh/MocA family oxidoreductase [Microbispora cellulosiformans]